ncbi:hypothetical protein [Draconibacterium halophilum]|uniref:Uncharacterized protein n=1 Tax=Draconibacterium halophilum TaxID=2706887 RepID=A0A6C0RG37_9BACT|nr:hypothetical protein [Draconibacterium halophilum]QIA09380.1 hypothetical protein G0Q07_17445 [Draconibacterium halophilum]
MNYRDLEAVRQIVDNATGLEITYAYEDLVFPDNGAFIIQFDESNTDNLFCYFQEGCNPKDQKNIFASLVNETTKMKATMELKGAYTLEQQDENIQIKFLQAKPL